MKKVELRKKLAIIAGMGIMACSLAACGGSKSDTTAATTKESTKEEAKKEKEEKKEEKTTEAKKEETTEAQTEASNDNSGQNPVMNLIGNYVSDRAAITVSCTGEDEAAFFVTWSSSASTHSEWTMSGKFNTENNTVSYTNCTRKTIEFNEDGSVANEIIDYENGSGTFEFVNSDGATALKWNDDVEAVASEMVFEYN